MVAKVASYVYHYGVMALVRRCLNCGYCPKSVGLLWLMRYGVQRVGTLFAVPTTKSFRVWRMVRRAKRVRIFLTVSEWWSGGAVYYLNQQLSGFEKGMLSLVVSPMGYLGCLTVRVYDGPEMVERFYVNGLSALCSICGNVVDIVVSTVVAWHNIVGQPRIDHFGIAELMRQVLKLKRALGCKLLYLLHDYYCVCPRLFLVGDDGQYCGAEFSGELCNACCAKDIDCAEQIAGGTNVLAWRNTMEDFLAEADEIRAFCQDTVDRMKKIFPKFKYTLVPHPEPTAIKRQPSVVFDNMHVGIIGNIGLNKGVDVIASLAEWLRVNYPSERLTIIGRWCCNRPCPDNVVQTGEYHQSELPTLIEKTGINIVLFSSTIPETFSYVMHEIVQLGLPVAAFDRGAQKDCAERYENGRVIPSLESPAIWQTLCALYVEVRNAT